MVEARGRPEVVGDGFTAASLRLAEGELPYLVGGSGPLVVLSYSLGPLAWGRLDRLAERCTVAVIDRPASPLPLDVINAYGWFGALARSLGFSRAALCTWSMGTPGALHYAAREPDELSHLILVDPAALRQRLFTPRRPVAPTPEDLREMVAGMWRFWVRSPAVDTRPLQELHLRQLQQPGSYERNVSANAEAARRPLLDILPRVRVPTLLLAGRHSGVFGPEAGTEAVARLPNGRLLISEESSHAVPLEDPDWFQDALAAFVHDDTEDPSTG